MEGAVDYNSDFAFSCKKNKKDDKIKKKQVS